MLVKMQEQGLRTSEEGDGVAVSPGWVGWAYTAAETLDTERADM